MTNTTQETSQANFAFLLLMCLVLGRHELSGSDAVALERHLDACPACQEVVKGLVGGLPGLPDERRNGRPHAWHAAIQAHVGTKQIHTGGGTCPSLDRLTNRDGDLRTILQTIDAAAPGERLRAAEAGRRSRGEVIVV